MNLQLHWSPKSPCVRKVMVCAHELGLTERIERVRSVAAMQKPNPQLMQHNPLSEIPTLVLPDGTALFDSAVICEYLNDLAGGSLFPTAPADRWRALRWQAFGDGLLDALTLWRNERERAQPLPPLIEAFALKTEASLHQLDDENQGLQELAFGIGQVSVGCALGYLDYRFPAVGWRSTTPRLAAWFAEVAARAAFRETEPADG